MYSEAFIADLKSRVTISEIIGRSMKLRRDGKEFRAVDNASLTINDQKALWFDHATGEGGDALAWLQKSQGLSFGDAIAEMASMAGVPLPNGDGQAGQPHQQGATTKRKPVASYNYCDAQAELIYQVVRLEWLEDGERCKTFRQRRPDPEKAGWIWNLEGMQHGLYRLPELREAGADDVIYLPEGEKDVETLIAFGLVATTNSGGAKNWRADHAEALRGRDVVVLVDADDPGRERGKAIVASLHGVASRVRLLDFSHPDIWPGAPKGADISDWVKTREGDAEELAAIVETLPDAKPAAGATPEEEPPLPTEIPESVGADPDHAPPQIEITSLPPLTVDDWIARDLPQPDFLSGHWLTTTSRVLLPATTGLGKSNLGIALGMRIAAGVNFLHWDNERAAKVLYIDGEMSRRLLRQRIIDEAGRVGQRPRNFHALSSEDIPDFKALNTAEGQLWISALIKKLGGIDLIIFDNIMSLIAGDMKDEEPWQQTLPWVRWLTRQAVGQIWIHHTGHDETRSYGTKTREWQMDTVIHSTW